MHVHFGGGADLVEENKALLPLYVAHGITTVRDASGDLPHQVLAWRGEIANGTLFGPTLLSSGPKIEGIAPVWKGTLETGSEARCRQAPSRRSRRLDVDFVKITDSTLRPELFLYAVRKARAAGLKASGHIPMALTVREAVDAGISSIEHLDYAFKAGVKDEAAIAADFAAGRHRPRRGEPAPRRRVRSRARDEGLPLSRREGRVGRADAQWEPHHRVSRSGHPSARRDIWPTSVRIAQDLRVAGATRRSGRRGGDCPEARALRSSGGGTALASAGGCDDPGRD